jgi:hypothetical protein
MTVSDPISKIDVYRLSIIISLPVVSEAQGEVFYEIVKKAIPSSQGLRISGNLTRLFDPCCGKEKT